MNRKTEQHYPTNGNNALTERMITRRIGRTTYDVSIYFSETNSETMNDKILRLIKNEVSGKGAL